MKNLKSLIKELVKVDAENECVEFKENNTEPEMIGEYVSALSNSATYHDRQYAYLVWGVNDETHEYTDTTFNFRTKKGAGNEDLEWQEETSVAWKQVEGTELQAKIR